MSFDVLNDKLLRKDKIFREIKIIEKMSKNFNITEFKCSYGRHFCQIC